MNNEDKPVPETSKRDVWIAAIKISPSVLTLILIIVVLFVFYGPIRDKVIPRLTGFKALGIEATFVEVKGAVIHDAEGNSLYFTTNEANQISERGERLRPILEKCNVLWVDDHPKNNDGIRHVLETFGIRFDIATSSAGAGEYYTNHMGLYDAVISDVSRDDKNDINGATFASHGAFGDVPVILFTAHFDEQRTNLPHHVYAVAHRAVHLIHYLFDVLERGGTPYPAGYQYNERHVSE